MGQNRNKLLGLFIGNISNAIIHKILERAIQIEEIARRYGKEIANSFDIARRYRKKINPLGRSFPEKDVEEIKERIIKNVKSELGVRIARGYKGISLDDVEEIVLKLSRTPE